MSESKNILMDSHNRKHSYLRISITERCNLRCTYCMPEEGIQLSPKNNIMTANEIFGIAQEFVAQGVDKIRLTGGEPLIRKDAKEIIEKLASLPVNLAITTNAVNVDQFIDTFKEHGLKDINVSLDSLSAEKNDLITRRKYFTKTYNNILQLIQEGFNVKLNTVLMRDFNEDEIVDFILLTKLNNLSIRFIEFMPFDGNQWNLDKIVSLEEILSRVNMHFGQNNVIRLQDANNDTAKNFSIKGYKGSFAVISSVTNPFCDSCNRLRLTANGQLKNCLFSDEESDLLTQFRTHKSISPIVKATLLQKQKMRNGMNSLEDFSTSNKHAKNRSMITIGG